MPGGFGPPLVSHEEDNRFLPEARERVSKFSFDCDEVRVTHMT